VEGEGKGGSPEPAARAYFIMSSATSNRSNRALLFLDGADEEGKRKEKKKKEKRQPRKNKVNLAAPSSRIDFL